MNLAEIAAVRGALDEADTCARRLHRRMRSLQAAALRLSKRGRYREANHRWKAMIRAHLVRSELLRHRRIFARAAALASRGAVRA